VKGSHGKPRHRLEDNIEMDLKNRVWECWLSSSASGQSPVMGSFEHNNETFSSIIGREFLLVFQEGFYFVVNNPFVCIISINTDISYVKYVKCHIF
jgi:hypothetical protein